MLLILLDKSLNYKEKILAVAPMMDWTDGTRIPFGSE
jgi:tRNA-dihydrouridine synthase